MAEENKSVDDGSGKEQAFIEKVKDFITEFEYEAISPSLIQRKFQISYEKSLSILERMGKEGSQKAIKILNRHYELHPDARPDKDKQPVTSERKMPPSQQQATPSSQPPVTPAPEKPKEEAGPQPGVKQEPPVSQTEVKVGAEEEKNNVTRLTRDATLGEKMKLVAGLYAKKMGRAVDNSAPFQMARDVRDSWRDFKSDVREMGQGVKDDFNHMRKSMRVRRKLAWRSTKNWVNDSAPVRLAKDVGGSFMGFVGDVKSLWQEGKEGVKNGVDWVKKAPGKALNWTGRKIKQGASWLGNKTKETANKLWNKFKQTKFAKNVAKRYTQVKNGVVKTAKAIGKGAVVAGMVVASPVIVTYKAGAAVYNGVNKAYNNTKNWFNEKAEVAARLQARSADKPNEQIQEAMEQNVHSDKVNEELTNDSKTKIQERAEAAVAEAKDKGETGGKTEATQQEQQGDQTPTTPTQGQERPAEQQPDNNQPTAQIAQMDTKSVRAQVREDFKSLQGNSEFGQMLAYCQVNSKSGQHTQRVADVAKKMEKLMTTSKEKGGLGLDPEKDANRIENLKVYLYKQGVKTDGFDPKKIQQKKAKEVQINQGREADQAIIKQMNDRGVHSA